MLVVDARSHACIGIAVNQRIAYIQGGPKNGYPVYFWDNIGNSVPILTILSLLQAEIYGA